MDSPKITTLKTDGQLHFTPWLINELITGHHAGLRWLNESDKILSIPWPRATDEMPLDDLGVIYCWHKYRKGLNYDQNRSPSTMKGTFRAIINSRNELKKMFSGNGELHLQIKDDIEEFNGTLIPDNASVIHVKEELQRTICFDDVTEFIDNNSDHYNNNKSSCHVNTTRSSGTVNIPCYSVPDTSSSFPTLEHYPLGAQSSFSDDEILSYELSTAPTWAQEVLLNEQNNSGTTCIANVTVFSRGRVMCEKKADLHEGLLIYSDTCEMDFNKLSDEECNKMYGRGSRYAAKVLLCEIQNNAHPGLEDALQNFNRGVLLFSDSHFNIMAQRHSRARAYVGHSNRGGPRHMKRSNSSTTIFSYISFLEMAGNLVTLRQNNKAINTSDLPTTTSIISVGQEWTMTRCIHELPLYIEIRHERAEDFVRHNLQFGNLNLASDVIVLSATDSVDTKASIIKAFELPPDLMRAMNEEMDDNDYKDCEDLVLQDLGIG